MGNSNFDTAILLRKEKVKPFEGFEIGKKDLRFSGGALLSSSSSSGGESSSWGESSSGGDSRLSCLVGI